MNSVVVTKLSHCSHLLAYGQASAASCREQYPCATQVLSISSRSHWIRFETMGLPTGAIVRACRLRVLLMASS